MPTDCHCIEDVKTKDALNPPPYLRYVGLHREKNRKRRLEKNWRRTVEKARNLSLEMAPWAGVDRSELRAVRSLHAPNNSKTIERLFG
ncbi:hypothetical protein PoB_005366500 [Plakobranchus ocellatus]|uniref:Uncharacterized protein n=1 Tax=Plakobranchus ocellatus TaxID=259542 RepID=A0AAV4C3B7_9GAST|nr:hypothetical protein PoB_005366500 [Plakobranchus ocellatus]